jgi:DNA replication protein DnaC
MLVVHCVFDFKHNPRCSTFIVEYSLSRFTPDYNMESLVAVGLAANILQFIHTARHVVLTSREILDSGTKNEYVELELITKGLRSRLDRIILPANARLVSEGDDGNSLEVLAVGCNEIADELLGYLDGLKLHNDRNTRESFVQALKTQWHDDKIKALRERLDRMAKVINARLADENNLGIISRLNELLEINRRLEITRTVDILALRTEFDQALRNNQNNARKEQSADLISKVASDGLHYSAEQKILFRLRFVRLEDRYRLISPAYRNTLAWLFSDTDSQGQHQVKKSSSFVQWLHSDNNLYWISGRPGSGKSTLMKFLCHHKKTKEHLATLAGNGEVIIAEYFFWNAGKNDLQKPQEGLLRSLLYQILRQCPNCIRLAFPGIWQCYNLTDTGFPANQDITLDTEMPQTVPELLDALSCVCDLHTKSVCTKSDPTESKKWLCFFIDGLDEYVGDSRDVIQLVGVLRNLERVKICVSSRQWNEFEDAFGGMQDFNHQDINAYINDVFENDSNYQELEDKETLGKKLIQEIVTAANGVFLWVVLVVRSLQDGLLEADSITRLQQRLRKLPMNLEELFERIIFRDVKETYRSEASHMFLVTLEAKENLPLMAYWFLGEDLPKQRLPLRMQQTIKRHKDANKRLIASCKGLLEPRFRSTTEQRDSLPSAILFEFTVDFLHRTVRDYLLLPATDVRQWAEPHFNPDEAICKALYSQIKTAPHGKEYSSHVSGLYHTYIYHSNALKRLRDSDTVIQSLSAELVDIVSEYGIKVFNPPAVEDTPNHDMVTDAKTYNAEKLEFVSLESSNTKSERAAKPHQGRPSAMERFVSKLSRVKPKLAAPTEDR